MNIPSKIEQVSVETLIPYARNSRTHSDAQVAQIAASIKEFGFTNPVLIDGGGESLLDMGGCSPRESWAFNMRHASDWDTSRTLKNAPMSSRTTASH